MVTETPPLFLSHLFPFMDWGFRTWVLQFPKDLTIASRPNTSPKDSASVSSNAFPLLVTQKTTHNHQHLMLLLLSNLFVGIFITIAVILGSPGPFNELFDVVNKTCTISMYIIPV